MPVKQLLQLSKERLKRSTLVRSLLRPYMSLKMLRVDNDYMASDDSSCLRRMRDVHAGERCFIIGNGPSLRCDDLDALVNEFTFASNGIYNIFEKTEWRPTYYVCVDRNALSLNIDEILSLNLNRMFLDVYAKNKIKDKKDNIILINQHLTHFDIHKYTTANIGFSEDPTCYLCSGYTVTYAAIQLAIYMGFSTIILLGVDHNYARSIDSQGRIKSVNNERDHFFQRKEPKGFYYYEGVEYAYSLANRVAQTKNIRIMNATRGGALEIFERAEFDSLVSR